LPVYFFIQGGGFNDNGNANYNGSGLLLAANMDLVVVTFNYRVGPYGFLASEAVREDGDLNAGLLDQRKALEWVQQHISKVRVNTFVANCVGLIVYDSSEAILNMSS
jgi:carboxylesterase type B